MRGGLGTRLSSYMCSLALMSISILYSALCRNRTLVTLELGTNALTNSSAQCLGDALKLNFKLEGLSLWQNEITGQGAQRLAEGLQVGSLYCSALTRILEWGSITSF